MAEEHPESTKILKQMLDLMKKKDKEEQNDSEPKCVCIDDCCKMAEKQFESTSILTQMLKLMQKDRKDSEPKCISINECCKMAEEQS